MKWGRGGLLTAVVAVVAAVALTPGAGGAPRLVVGDRAELLVEEVGSKAYGFLLAPASSSPVPASLEVDIPRGYQLTLPAPGKLVGNVNFSLEDQAAGSGGFADAHGALVAQDPAQFATDPCAPGVHAAVWLLTASIVGRQLTLPFFVDQPADGDAGYVLKACPAAAFAAIGSQTLSLLDLDLFFGSAAIAPTAPGVYTWHALVTLTADGQPYELRATLALPQALTLRAAFDPNKHVATLSGIFTEQGRPAAGATLSVDVETQVGATVRQQFDAAQATTAADGSYTLRLPVKSSTVFVIAPVPTPGSCAAPSAAPAGCASETTVGVVYASASVTIPRKTDARRALRAVDQRAAGRITFTAADFPPDWQAAPATFGICVHADERDLTVTGHKESPTFYRDDTNAHSVTAVRVEARVFASEPQAAGAFTREATAAAVRCLVQGLPPSVNAAIKPLPLPKLAPDTRGFKVSIQAGSTSIALDVVFLRRGRALAVVEVEREGVTTVSTAALARKIAARMR